MSASKARDHTVLYSYTVQRVCKPNSLTTHSVHSIVPESMRWLAAHGRLKEAEEVVDQMARYNGTKKPANTSAILKQVAEEELRGRQSNRKYTYLDLYKPWSLCWKSFIIQIIW